MSASQGKEQELFCAVCLGNPCDISTGSSSSSSGIGSGSPSSHGQKLRRSPRLLGRHKKQENHRKIHKQPSNVVARPSSCSHIFCLACIKRWATVVNTCPLCKESFTALDLIDPTTRRVCGQEKVKSLSIDYFLLDPEAEDEDEDEHEYEDEDEHEYEDEDEMAIFLSPRETDDDDDEDIEDGWTLLTQRRRRARRRARLATRSARFSYFLSGSDDDDDDDDDGDDCDTNGARHAGPLRRSSRLHQRRRQHGHEGGPGDRNGSETSHGCASHTAQASLLTSSSVLSTTCSVDTSPLPRVLSRSPAAASAATSTSTSASASAAATGSSPLPTTGATTTSSSAASDLQRSPCFGRDASRAQRHRARRRTRRQARRRHIVEDDAADGVDEEQQQEEEEEEFVLVRKRAKRCARDTTSSTRPSLPSPSEPASSLQGAKPRRNKQLVTSDSDDDSNDDDDDDDDDSPFCHQGGPCVKQMREGSGEQPRVRAASGETSSAHTSSKRRLFEQQPRQRSQHVVLSESDSDEALCGAEACDVQRASVCQATSAADGLHCHGEQARCTNTTPVLFGDEDDEEEDEEEEDEEDEEGKEGREGKGDDGKQFTPVIDDRAAGKATGRDLCDSACWPRARRESLEAGGVGQGAMSPPIPLVADPLRFPCSTVPSSPVWRRRRYNRNTSTSTPADDCESLDSGYMGTPFCEEGERGGYGEMPGAEEVQGCRTELCQPRAMKAKKANHQEQQQTRGTQRGRQRRRRPIGFHQAHQATTNPLQ